MSTTNLTKHLVKQGVNKTTLHEAVVVDNKDPDKLGRIKARIKELHQGIEDKHLPWAIPLFGHADGAKGGKDFDRSGTFYVPKKGHKVLIRFQDNDVHHPIWSGYTVDDKTRLMEMNKNYPDRACVRFSNGSFIIIDTHSHELFIHNAGDLYTITQGDMETNNLGNVQHVVGKSQGTAIDKYFTNDKELPVKDTKQHQEKKVKWKGLGSGSKSGNYHVEVEGDYTVHVKGNRIVHIDGTDELVVGRSRDVKIGTSWDLQAGTTGKIQCGATLTCKASIIMLN